CRRTPSALECPLVFGPRTLLARNDREQEEGISPRARMKGIRPHQVGEETIIWIGVEKPAGPAAIVRFDIEREAMTGLKDHTGWPDLDIGRNHLRGAAGHPGPKGGPTDFCRG